MVAHQIAASLGPEMSCALLCFDGLGKKTAWSTRKSLPEQTDGLLMFVDGPKEIPDDAMNTIERFVILLFDRTSTCTKVNMQEGSSFYEKKTRCSKFRLPELF